MQKSQKVADEKYLAKKVKFREWDKHEKHSRCNPREY